ncbi:MAG: hypothetical protein HZC16_03660 [Candidatus Omnitrophica bacterium]|nr:hypothetical protein [Candidatus Omnitrophota bacterium]
MLTGINIYETKPYKSKLDPDKDNPSVFHIGSLDSYLRAYIEDQTTSFEFSSKNPKDPAKANINASKRNLLVVRFGLKGLDNFLDPRDKKPVKFDSVSVSLIGKNYTAVSEEILSMLPKALIDELAEVILAENTLSEEEAKN